MTTSPPVSVHIAISNLTIVSLNLSNSTFVGGSGAGTVVGTITVTMSSGSFTGTLSVDDTTHFQIVGNQLQLATTVANGTYPITITATQASASNSPFPQSESIVGSAASALGLVRTITNVDTNPVPSTSFWTMGHPFGLDEVASNQIVTAKLNNIPVPVQAVARITHQDGSLAWAQLLVDMSLVSAGSAWASGVAYNLVLTPATGTWSSTTTRTNADWTGLVDTVEITSLTTSSPSAPDMNGAGTWVAAFDGGSSNTITTYGSSPLGLWVDVFANFVNSGVTHRFLQAHMEYWVCQKADGSLGPVRSFGPVIENTQLFKANPGSFNYNISWKRNGTAVRTFTGVQHWAGALATCIREDAQGDWSSSEPIVVVTQDYKKTRATKKIIPFADSLSTYNPAVEWSASISTSTGLVTATANGLFPVGIDASPFFPVVVSFRGTVLPSGTGFAAGNIYWGVYNDANSLFIYDNYTDAIAAGSTGKLIPTGAGSGLFIRVAAGPFARGNMSTNFSGAGPRNDLGIISEWSAWYHVPNTQASQHSGRVNAWCIAAVPISVRNNATGKIPGLIPTAQLPAGLGTGLPNCNALDGTVSSEFGAGTGIITGTPGMGALVVDSSHWPSPSIAVWLMEGGAILRSLITFNGNRAVFQQSFLPNRNLQVNGVGTTYNGVVITESGENFRTGFWSLRDIFYAAFVNPNGSDERTYFMQVLKNNLDWQVADRASKSANYQNNGLYVYDVYTPAARRDLSLESAFMSYYGAITLGYGNLLLGDQTAISTNLTSFINSFCETWLAQWWTGPGQLYFGSGYGWGYLYLATDYISGYSDVINHFDAGGNPTFYAYSTGASGTITWSGGPVLPFGTVSVGDYFFPTDVDISTETPGNPPPSPLVEYNKYQVKTVDNVAQTFTISNVGGGSTITFAAAVTGGVGAWHFNTYPSSGTAAGGLFSSSSSYTAWAQAAFATISIAGGFPNSSSAYTSAKNLFVSGGGIYDVAAWTLQNTP